MSKHTPPPWEIEHKYAEHPHDRNDPGHYTIEAAMPGCNRSGSVMDSLNRDHVISPEEDRANMTLACAAPDMAVALQLFLRITDSPPENPLALRCDRDRFVTLARAALEKAGVS